MIESTEQLVAGEPTEAPEGEQHLSLLRDAAREIRALRERLSIQDAKVMTMELCAGLGRQQSLRDFAGQGVAYGIDIAWQLDRAVELATRRSVQSAKGSPVSPAEQLSRDLTDAARSESLGG